jgi:hypothetical protein
LLWMTWLPKKGMKHLVVRPYQRKIKQSWRKFFSAAKGCSRPSQGCWSSKRSTWTHRPRSPSWH